RQAESVFREIVESILTTNCQDAHHIEQTLDGLLGFCGHDSLLLRRHRAGYDRARTGGQAPESCRQAIDRVGLVITEHLPWDVLRLKNALADVLPSFVPRGPCDA